MTDLFEPYRRQRRASARFFVRIGGKAVGRRRCEHTAPLFPLWAADGTLPREVRHLVERTQA